MRVEIKTQKDVPHVSYSGDPRSNTEYAVVIQDAGREVKVASFLTPGTFLDGFLSETQAKKRAAETADRLKTFLAARGQLDIEAVVEEKRTPKRRPLEERSFARAG